MNISKQYYNDLLDEHKKIFEWKKLNKHPFFIINLNYLFKEAFEYVTTKKLISDKL